MAIKQGNKMVYIGAVDVTWWERGEALAQKRGIPLSKLISRLLRNEDISQQVNPEKTLADLYDEIDELMVEVRRRTLAGEKLQEVS